MDGTNGRLHGKRALITGAASGIGRATAVRYAQDGARVALLDVQRNLLDEVTQEITAAGGIVLAIPTDVSNENEVAAAVKKAVAEWGGLDVIVGVAGIELYAEGDTKVHELELAVWQRTLDTNLTGMFLTLKHGVAALLGSGGGSVIVTGSPTGLFGFAAGETAYSASKSGCHALARVVATDYASQGVRVNVVVPGFIDTPINAAFMQDAQAVADISKGIPLGRPGRPEEVAAMNAWLASDESSYATGAFFIVDGGQTSV